MALGAQRVSRGTIEKRVPWPEISVIGMKLYTYEDSSPDVRDETVFDKITLLSQHSGQNNIIFALYVLPLQKNANYL